MATWRARNYGHGWELTKARYRRRRPWARCYWCLRAPARSGKRWSTSRDFELHHLWYGFSRDYRPWRPTWMLMGVLRLLFGLREWRTGQVPLIVVRPMCEPCHDRETRWTRQLWPGARHGAGLFAHAFVTLGVRWAYITVVLLGLCLAAVRVGLWSTIVG